MSQADWLDRCGNDLSLNSLNRSRSLSAMNCPQSSVQAGSTPRYIDGTNPQFASA